MITEQIDKSQDRLLAQFARLTPAQQSSIAYLIEKMAAAQDNSKPNVIRFPQKQGAP